MTDRGQANLVGFAVAIIVVTTVTVVGGALASDALADADRRPATDHATERLAEHLVAADAAHTRGQNVLRSSAVATLRASALDDAVPPVRNRSIYVSLGGDVLVARGDLDTATDRRPSDTGPTNARSQSIERRVRVERDVRRTERVDLAARRAVALPDHTGSVDLTFPPDRSRTVTTVRAGGRVVLYDPDGLTDSYSVQVPGTHPLTIEFDGVSRERGRDPGTVTVAWTTTNASVEPLVVTVGA